MNFYHYEIKIVFFFVIFTFRGISKRKIETFNIEIDWGASLVLHTRGYPYSIPLPFFEGEISKNATWSGPPSDRCLSSLLSIFVRFQSRKMSRNIQGGDRRRVGLESFIDSDSVLSVIDEIWLRIEALLYWYSSMFHETLRDIRHDEDMLFYKIDFVQKFFFFFFVQFWIHF